LYQGILFNKGMVLHDAGRNQAALPLLLQVERLRIASLGKDHPRVGDTERMIGEVLAALGRDEAARSRLVNAVTLTTRAGIDAYGPSHPHTRRAQLSLTLFDLSRSDPPASSVLAQLEQLAALPKSDPELRKIAWRASTALANQRCREPGFGGGQEMLDGIAAEMAEALPEGGSVVRAFERERSRCR
jgi:serine/threonine-protein kinase